MTIKKFLLAFIFLSAVATNVWACPTIGYVYCDAQGNQLGTFITPSKLGFYPQCQVKWKGEIAWGKRPAGTAYMEYTDGAIQFFGWNAGAYSYCKGVTDSQGKEVCKSKYGQGGGYEDPYWFGEIVQAVCMRSGMGPH